MIKNFCSLCACFICVSLMQMSCVEQFTPQLEGFNPNQLIVVEGQITDQEGPFRVRITSTFEIENLQLWPPPVYGAEVQIFDDKGNHYQLYHTLDGWYETENKQLKGVIGNTYTLNITMADGTEYESSSVAMLDAPEISDLYFEETQKSRLEEGAVVSEKWLDIFLDVRDTNGGTEYWKWDLEEVWEVHTLKDSAHLLIEPIGSPPFTIVANLEYRKGNVHMGWDNNKEKCWVKVPSTSILIKSTNKDHINQVIKYPIKSIAPGGDRLHIRYSILAKQTALSKEMFVYWERLKEINEESGSIYDKVPSQIFGNIRCCGGNQKVLGYFSASAVKTKRIFISPKDHKIEARNAYDGCKFDPPDRTGSLVNYYLGHITAVSDTARYSSWIGKEIVSYEPWCADCRMYAMDIIGGESRSIKPDFWED